MILLDTNVVSELMRIPRDAAVDTWFRHQKRGNLFICAITVAEIERGICRLPEGKRRDGLRRSFEGFMDQAFTHHVWPFNEDAAQLFGAIAASKERSGMSTSMLDLMIAAIALTNNAKLATRNTRDFEGCGIELINPWLETTGPS